VLALRHQAEAERRCALTMQRLMVAGYHLLHDRLLPGTTAQTDHILIGPTGVHLITDLRPQATTLHLAGERLWDGPVPLTVTFERLWWEVDQLIGALERTLLEGWFVPVAPILAIHRATLPAGLSSVADTVVVPYAAVPGFITQAAPALSLTEVAYLAGLIEQLCPAAGDYLDLPAWWKTLAGLGQGQDRP